MRRAILVLSAVLAAVAISAFSAVLAQAQAADQYDNADGGAEEAGATPVADPGTDDSVVSQGSIGGEAPSQEAAERAVADLAEEERLPDYSQIVGNTTKGRFSASSSKAVKDSTAHEGSYVTSGRSATFKVKIPTSSDYSVYAWWPAAGKDAGEVDFSVPVASGGSKAESVDQARDGGTWVKLGTYEMTKGERKISLSGKGDATALADAVAVMRGEFAAPPDDSYDSPALSASGKSSDGRTATSRSTATERKKVERSARRWMGTPYKYATCTTARMSCTCLTKRAWSPHGHKLSTIEARQWRYEPSKVIRSKGNLKRGDVVFFKEGGSRNFTHVGIYSGNGNLIHASNYYRYEKVVESKMKYVTGYAGAIRMSPR